MIDTAHPVGVSVGIPAARRTGQGGRRTRPWRCNVSAEAPGAAHRTAGARARHRRRVSLVQGRAEAFLAGHQVRHPARHALPARRRGSCWTRRSASPRRRIPHGLLGDVVVLRNGARAARINTPAIEHNALLRWRVELEGGGERRGEVRAWDLPERGSHAARRTVVRAARSRSCRRICRWVITACTSISNSPARESCPLIVTPDKCFEPGDAGRRRASSGAWPCSSTRCARPATGASATSPISRKCCGWPRRQGADFVGISPVHALFPSDPTLYLAVQRLEPARAEHHVHRRRGGARSAGLAPRAGHHGGFRLSRAPREGARHHAGGLSRRWPVSRCRCCRRPSSAFAPSTWRATPRAPRPAAPSCASAASRCGCTRCSMRSTGICAVLTAPRGLAQLARGVSSSGERRGAPLRARRTPTTVDFHGYLQWLAAEQFGAVRQLARELALNVGLYGDYAVGVNASGSETWSDQTLYCTGAAIGAPPDPIGVGGQEWGIPPQDPRALRRAGLRAVRGAGARQHAQLRRAAPRSRDGAVPPVVGAARLQVRRRWLRALSTRGIAGRGGARESPAAMPGGGRGPRRGARRDPPRAATVRRVSLQGGHVRTEERRVRRAGATTCVMRWRP